MEDLNSEVSKNCLYCFRNFSSFKTLNRGPTCLKYANNPSCMDLLLTNRQRCFQQRYATETGISDFHRMVLTVIKTRYKMQNPKTIQYINYKHFHEQPFNFDLDNDLQKIDINNAEFQQNFFS